MNNGAKEIRFIKLPVRNVILMALFAAALGGCSSLYQDTIDFFTGEDSSASAQPKIERQRPEPDLNQPFPNLASVPSGLAADTQHRKYSAEPVARQEASPQKLEGELAAAVTKPPEMPPPVTPGRKPDSGENIFGAKAPAPQPDPKLPVASAPIGAKAPPAPPIPAPYASIPPAMQPSTLVPGLSDYAPAPEGVSARETFMARLSQRLPYRAETPPPQQPAEQPAGQAASGDSFTPPPLERQGYQGAFGDPYETVVISSSGVSQGDAFGSAGYAPIAPSGAPSGGQPFEAEPSSDGDYLAIPMTGVPLGPGAIKVATILFNNGSAELDANDHQILAQVLQIHRQQGGNIRIIGHSSSRTRNMEAVRHKMTNYQISANRASAVATQLAELGVPSGQISIDAKSDTVPMYYEYMPSGEAGNRRAEIYLE